MASHEEHNMVEPGAPGQKDKEQGKPKEEGKPKATGVLPGQGRLPGRGKKRGTGRLPTEGKLPGADGQVDRGSPGQMDKGAENPWSVEQAEERHAPPKLPDVG
jgi:hypothetical protein